MKVTLQALRAGHWPSLIGAWLHFEVSFMVWLLVGALGVAIAEEFSLTATQKGFMVGLPLLGGALLRVAVGPLADSFGAKLVGLWIIVLEIPALLYGWLFASGYIHILGVGFLLGFAGASFAIALPIASQAYPPGQQGLAMGVAAIGNSGAILATFLAPRIAELVGWQNTFGWMVVPVLLTGILFWFLVLPDDHLKTSARRVDRSLTRGRVVRRPFLYWLCFLYSVTFGGFVGFASFLPIYFHDQYGFSMVTAGTVTAVCAVAGSLARPVGGHLADRLGGVRLLRILFVILTFMGGIMSLMHNPAFGVVTLILVLLLLGFGNGVVFQVASLRFQGVMGTAAGLIGAAGGLGGFILTSWFGLLKDYTGTYATGFLIFGLVSFVMFLSVVVVTRSVPQLVQQPVEGGSS